MEMRVVVTGIGVITSLGFDKDTFWNNAFGAGNCRS